MVGAACGLPEAASAAMAAETSAKLSEARPANGSSWARAPGAASSTSRTSRQRRSVMPGFQVRDGAGARGPLASLREAPSPARRERGPWRLLGGAAALAGLDVEVAARHRRAPIGDQVARAFEVRRPLLCHDGARRLPDHVELPIALHLADQ